MQRFDDLVIKQFTQQNTVTLLRLGKDPIYLSGMVARECVETHSCFCILSLTRGYGVCGQVFLPMGHLAVMARLPANAVSFVDTQRVVQFLTTHAEANAILLPGRIPGYKRTDVQLLPSSTTKRQVWLQYCSSLQSLSQTHHQVAYSTFCTLWRQLVPHIQAMKPMSDLCWICQSNSTAIMQAANHPEEEKSEVKGSV